MVSLNALLTCLIKTKIKMNAVIYARVSSVGDRQNTERQISDLSEYAAFQKLQVSQIYEEKISGAKKNRERPVLMEAIEYCKESKVSFLSIASFTFSSVALLFNLGFVIVSVDSF